MFEKVNPSHPDKVADRIAGAIVDLAYKKQENPKIAVEVLVGHKNCHIITESSVIFEKSEIEKIIERIIDHEFILVDLYQAVQDKHLALNQKNDIRCGDNGIFKGTPITLEQNKLIKIAKSIYTTYPYDGKYILDLKNKPELVICQSNARFEDLRKLYKKALINPLGEWTGGINVDTGATNRKLGSDMGDSITGGGLHGKDLSKADVSVNIYAWLKAQKLCKPVEISCAIGDTVIDGKPYREIVEIARNYINGLGGFEKFAEWGLLR